MILDENGLDKGLDKSVVRDARSLDKFYTKPETASLCIGYLLATLQEKNIGSPSLWVEPSAGSGVFLERMPTPRIGIDISPPARLAADKEIKQGIVGTGEEIIQANFLAWRPSCKDAVVATVGNPPFGRNANMAVRFFNHAATFSDIIAMIFPRTFEKESIQRRLDVRFHLEGSMAIGRAAFTFLGRDYDVPTVFQIWAMRAMGSHKREKTVVMRETEDFFFIDRENADFAFQRVGVGAGRLKENPERLSRSSHLFMKARGISPSLLKSRIRDLDFSEVKFSTAGNPSISRNELVKIYTRKYSSI